MRDQPQSRSGLARRAAAIVLTLLSISTAIGLTPPDLPDYFVDRLSGVATIENGIGTWSDPQGCAPASGTVATITTIRA